jgi:ubiquinone biosynthesis protein
MEEQVGMHAMLHSIRENLPMMVEKLPELPELIYAAAKNLASETGPDEQLAELQKLQREIRRANQRSVLTIAGASLLMSAFIVFGLDGYSPAMVWGAPVISWVIGGLGGFILLVSLQD